MTAPSSTQTHPPAPPSTLRQLPGPTLKPLLLWSAGRAAQSLALAALLSAGLLHLPEGQAFFLISGGLIGSVNLMGELQHLPMTRLTLGPAGSLDLPRREQLIATALCCAPVLSVQLPGHGSLWGLSLTLLITGVAVRGLRLGAASQAR